MFVMTIVIFSSKLSYAKSYVSKVYNKHKSLKYTIDQIISNRFVMESLQETLSFIFFTTNLAVVVFPQTNGQFPANFSQIALKILKYTIERRRTFRFWIYFKTGKNLAISAEARGETLCRGCLGRYFISYKSGKKIYFRECFTRESFSCIQIICHSEQLNLNIFVDGNNNSYALMRNLSVNSCEIHIKIFYAEKWMYIMFFNALFYFCL